jgi:hypothetical protein
MARQVGSWYNTSWKYRWPISINVSTAGATSDVTVDIPADFDLFWNNVLSSGNDIRVTDADGRTLLTYDIAAGFNSTTRVGQLELDNVSTVTGSTDGCSNQLAWLYWGNSGASDARSAFAPAAAISGYICLEQPSPDRTVRASNALFSQTRPRERLAVHVGATAGSKPDIWFDLTDVLVGRSRPYNSASGYEAPRGTYLWVGNESSKATVANASIESAARFCYDSQGRIYAKFRLDMSGTMSTAAATYTASCSVFSTVDSSKVSVYSVALYGHDLIT